MKPTPHIAFLAVDFMIPASRSLKEKRFVLRSLKDRIRSKFNVSVAELEDHDKWQKCVLGVCALGTDKARLNSTLENILSLVERRGEVRILKQQIEFI